MPQSFCTICRTRIAKGSRCSKHRIVSPSSRSWHQKGAAKLRRALVEAPGACCTVCGASADLQVHHVVPAREDGPTVPTNLRVLCAECHRQVESGQLQLECHRQIAP